ncbi:Cationic amino acid transporter, C-terminal [Sesbania bispinosa]|nr:Cationic amino acid transporter, C-terminal [Sesbania bispinosa]
MESARMEENGNSNSNMATDHDDVVPAAIKLKSFESLSNYGRAVLKTPFRLVDRVMARSMDEVECVIGAGIFVLTGLEVKNHVGPLSFLTLSPAFPPCCLFLLHRICCEIPVAGGSFAYIRVELGDFLAFIASGNILLEYVVAGAAVARSWTSYFATLCNQDSDKFLIHVNGLSHDYNQLDPIAVLVLSIVCLFAIFSTKGSSRFNYIASIVHVVVLLFIIVAGLTKAKSQNYSDFVPFGPRGIFQASAVLFLLMLVLMLFQPWQRRQRILEETYHWPYRLNGNDHIHILLLWVKQGISHTLLEQMLPHWLARVNKRTGTPIYATVVILCHCYYAFFTSLDILANILSISTLFLFSLVALALLVRRYCARGVTTRFNIVKFIGCIVLILGSSIGSAVYWSTSKGWIGYAILVPIWLVGTLGIWILVPLAKKPKIWGVPLVPFLPSASIGINIFLLGTLDKASFKRFGMWTAILVVYYLLVGLHASYDIAKAQKEEREKLEIKAQSSLDEENGHPLETESGTKK